MLFILLTRDAPVLGRDRACRLPNVLVTDHDYGIRNLRRRTCRSRLGLPAGCIQTAGDLALHPCYRARPAPLATANRSKGLPGTGSRLWRWSRRKNKRLNRAVCRKQSREGMVVGQPLDFLRWKMRFREHPQSLRVGHAESKQHQVPDIAEDCFEKVLPSGMRVKLCERLVGEGEMQAELPRFRE